MSFEIVVGEPSKIFGLACTHQVPDSLTNIKFAGKLPIWLSIWQMIRGTFLSFSSVSFLTGAVFHITTLPVSSPTKKHKYWKSTNRKWQNTLNKKKIYTAVLCTRIFHIHFSNIFKFIIHFPSSWLFLNHFLPCEVPWWETIVL